MSFSFKEIIKNLLKIPVRIFRHFFIKPIIFLFSQYREIYFVRIFHSRLGHLALNTELFLRRKKLGLIKENAIYIFLILRSKKYPVANNFLISMIKRQGKAIDGFLAKLVFISVNRTKYLYDLSGFYMMSNEYSEFNNTMPALSFIIEEEQKAREILKDMGIQENDWFVGIFSRDNLYLDTIEPDFTKSKPRYHEYRDGNIDMYIDAVKFIIDKGGFVVRLGKIQAKKMNFRHPRFIDYSFSEFKSDFMDIYLNAKCKFILTSPSGATDVARIFDTPYCGVNSMPIDHAPFNKNAIFIPKKLKKRDTGKYLSLTSYLDLLTSAPDPFGASLKTSFYDKNNIEIIDNSSKEILDITKEMFDRLNGTFVETQCDIERQLKYQKIRSTSMRFGGINKNPVGRQFLQDNEWLIN